MTHDNPFTEEWLAEVKTRRGRGSTDARRTTARGGSSCEAAIQQTKSRRSESAPSPFAPYRSKLERAYAHQLELEQRAGLIAGWLYEPFSFALAPGKRYRVDFVTWGPHGTECIEVKGTWIKNRRDGITRLSWAAQRFPFLTWRIVWRTKWGGWDGQYITSHD